MKQQGLHDQETRFMNDKNVKTMLMCGSLVRCVNEFVCKHDLEISCWTFWNPVWKNYGTKYIYWGLYSFDWEENKNKYINKRYININRISLSQESCKIKHMRVDTQNIIHILRIFLFFQFLPRREGERERGKGEGSGGEGLRGKVISRNMDFRWPCTTPASIHHSLNHDLWPVHKICVTVCAFLLFSTYYQNLKIVYIFSILQLLLLL